MGIRARRNACEATFAETKSPAESRLSRFVVDKTAPRNKSRRRFAHQGRQREAISLMEWSAVPACGFANCTRAASDPASPALRPGREELATGERRKIRFLFQEAQPEAELRRKKPRRVPRRSAERRARPQADARGNADRPWRAPCRLAGSGVSSETPVRITTLRLSALRPPYFIWGSFRAVAWQDSDANKKRAARMRLLVHLSPLCGERSSRGARRVRGRCSCSERSRNSRWQGERDN
jgi:hypothetical protein